MKKLQLKEEHVQHLITLPENGMGYQVVDITLKGGNILKKRVVLNSNLLLLEADVYKRQQWVIVLASNKILLPASRC